MKKNIVIFIYCLISLINLDGLALIDSDNFVFIPFKVDLGDGITIVNKNSELFQIDTAMIEAQISFSKEIISQKGDRFDFIKNRGVELQITISESVYKLKQPDHSNLSKIDMFEKNGYEIIKNEVRIEFEDYYRGIVIWHNIEFKTMNGKDEYLRFEFLKYDNQWQFYYIRPHQNRIPEGMYTP